VALINTCSGTVDTLSLTTSTMYFTLPDLPGICQDPFSPSFNPHYEAVASESKVWIDSLGILSGEKQKYFSNSAFEFLAAHTGSRCGRQHSEASDGSDGKDKGLW